MSENGLKPGLLMDTNRNATVPVVLAHHYTAISLVPGGRVLDILTRKALKKEKAVANEGAP